MNHPPKMALLSKKFMVPGSTVGLGLGNELLGAGLPPWLIIATMAAGLIYAFIEALVDIARMKYAKCANCGQGAIVVSVPAGSAAPPPTP